VQLEGVRRKYEDTVYCADVLEVPVESLLEFPVLSILLSVCMKDANKFDYRIQLL
jgi:hypothetical protein